MWNRPLFVLGLACLAATGFALPAAADASAPLGQVAAVAGQPNAVGAEGAPRALVCGDGVYGGDRITTDASSRVGLLVGDALAYVGEGSDVSVAADGTLHLHAGKLRMVDPIGDEIAGRIAAVDAETRIRGNDAEAYVVKEKIGRYAMLCEWDEPLPVTRGEEEKVAQPGECVIAKPGEPLYTAKTHDERIGDLGEDHCPFGDVPTRDLADRLPLLDVAAVPPDFDPVPPVSPGLPVLDPCDNPGSGCGAAATSAPVTVIIEPDPGTGGIPGVPGGS